MKKVTIHIYTGDGKGKTTAALGLALRSIGANKHVAIVQFMKSKDTSEYKAIKKYKLPIDIFCFGAGFCGILGDKKPKNEHRKEAEKGMKKTEAILKSGKYDLVILDEINVIVDCDLINVADIISVIKTNKTAELVLTGRNAHPKLKKMADLVSVIKKEKHYFDKGIKARKGIEY